MRNVSKVWRQRLSWFSITGVSRDSKERHAEPNKPELEDHELLALATSFRRVTVTQDIRFKVLAEDWQRAERPFAGLVCAHQRYVSYW